MAIQLEDTPSESATLGTPSLEIPSLEEFNHYPASSAECHLLTLCGSRRWALTLSHRRPYDNPAHLFHDATNLWFLLDEHDWLEAFACHPRIGERTSQPAASCAEAGFQAHAQAEQQATQQTLSSPLAAALAAANRQYEQRFGFLYIVFASGRTAPELFALLEQRLRNDRITELHEAARQQHAITSLRMNKWLED